ncbi:phosphoglycolate/pyridoxal phosphate phosphatase family protein [Trichuris suis]|nr:phosphoglycolate/pyridoxal phosphate phosphatase family protein [Trichuris suis]
MAVPLSKSILQHLWDKFDCFLLDCDGVLWRGSVPIPGAGAAIDLMKKHGKRVILVTNNSTKGPPQYVEKCRKLGINVSTENDIVTSSRVASIYLKNLPNRTGKVYVLGGQGLGNELKAANVDHFGIGPDYSENHTFVDDQSVSVELENDVFAVLVGFDRYICYNKMVKAVSYLRNEKCLFLATNDDAFFPSENSRIALPGAGSIVQAISYSSQRKPIVLGKPHSPMFQYVRDVLKIDPKKTMMIGDWPPTDIRFARRNGLASMLVLSGNATIEHAQKPEDRETTAYFYCNSLKTLCDLESV